MMLPGRDRCHGEKILDRGSLYRRWGCRDKATGRLLGARCPGLRSRERGSWYFSADLPSATGDWHRARRGGFATQDAAAAALEPLASPAAGPEPGLSTREWLSRWLASRVSLRASTSRGYAAHMRSYLVSYLGGIPLAALTAGDVQAMFTAVIRDEGALGRPVSAAKLVAASGLPPVTLHGLRHGACAVPKPCAWLDLLFFARLSTPGTTTATARTGACGSDPRSASTATPSISPPESSAGRFSAA
jgi:hypothetical protein